MADPSPDAPPMSTSGLLGPDPGLPIRRWVAMILRLGIGLSLLSIGLAAYFASHGPMGGPNFPVLGGSLSAIGPFVSSLPYLAIGLGMALVVGFLLTAASIATACLVVMVPLLLAISLIASGGDMMFGGVGGRGGGWGPDQTVAVVIVVAVYLPSLIPLIALIWLSPIENHPFSIDALIFGRAEPEAFSAADPAVSPESMGDRASAG